MRAVADGEVDLVETDGVAVAGLAGWFHELVIVGVFVLGMETSAQAEIGEFDVATAIEKNVVGLDITMVARDLMSASIRSSVSKTRFTENKYSQEFAQTTGLMNKHSGVWFLAVPLEQAVAGTG